MDSRCGLGAFCEAKCVGRARRFFARDAAATTAAVAGPPALACATTAHHTPHARPHTTSPKAGFAAGVAQARETGAGTAGAHASPATPATPAPPTTTAAATPARDSFARSAVKALVWRVFSACATVTLALLVLKDVDVVDALKFGGVEAAVKFVLYVMHERLWVLAGAVL